jgi:hypothetical protein
MLLKFRKLIRQPIRNNSLDEVTLDGNSLVLEDLIRLGKGTTKLQIGDNSLKKLK